jgi:SAM-dependent methyltransferase
MRPEPAGGGTLVRSPYASQFAHMGFVYVYHDLFGYLLKMSRDVVDLLNAFAVPRRVEQVMASPGLTVPAEQVAELVAVLVGQSCLVPKGLDERSQVPDLYPVKGAWVLGVTDARGGLQLVTARRGQVTREPLRAWERRLWERIDGNRSVRTLADDVRASTPRGQAAPTDAEVVETVARWVHHQRQFLRQSHYPLQMYRPVSFPMPPYLRSTMPYEPFDPASPAERPLPEQRVIAATGHYRDDDRPALARFDDDETTLSHLFRRPHAGLRGRTWGAALFQALEARGALPPSGARVLEIGGGTGALAAGFLQALAARWPERRSAFRYAILELSPALARHQRRALADAPVPVQHLSGDAGRVDLGHGQWDVVIANEMIGDLAVARLQRDEAAALLAGSPPADLPDEWVDVLRRHPGVLAAEDLPDEAFYNVGAFRLLERVADALAPGGWAYLSEFGDEHRLPVLSEHLDHPEFSIHFGHLRRVATDLGLEVRFEEVVDLLDVDGSVEVLATTRGQFASLREVARRLGGRLDKRAYTRSELAADLGPRLPLDRVEGLRFQPLLQRVMGLQPTDFKALVVHRPAARRPH